MGDNLPVPIATYPVPSLCTDLAFTQDEAGIVLLFRNGSTTLIRLNQPREIDAQIGEAVIRWDVPSSAPSSDRWPAIKFESRIKHGEAPVPSTLILDVKNEGTGPTHQLRAALTVDPPLEASKPVANLGTLHFGTLNESISVIRFLDLPLEPQLFAKARRFTLTLTARDGFNPPPKHWLHLPRTLEDEQAYHAMAKDIFDRATEALAKAKGSPFKVAPQLRAMSASEFGFRVSFGDIVMYQNPFVMDESALRVNRAVMQVDSHDQLMRHGQMMLFWYLPHELVHCADHRTSWATEYVANTIQPYLTARILEAMPDAPLSAQSMAYVYDRYVEVLRPHLAAQDIARVERFIQSEGQGPPPWNMSAPELFRSNTPAYVYFGARINQHAWSKQTTLEDLCRQLLAPSEPARDVPGQ